MIELHISTIDSSTNKLSWCFTKYFSTKDECYNYIESNYDLKNPSNPYSFNITYNTKSL